MKRIFILSALKLIILFSGNAFGADSAANSASLGEQAQKLKAEIISLNRELAALEEELLYPPEVKFGIFLSLDEKSRFKLDSIELFVDDSLVATHLYDNQDVEALLSGGLQQLYLGSVAPGQHKLTASFNGQGRTGGYFKRKKSLRFEKTSDARYIQLIVSESPGSGEPVFKVKQW